jgi:hypothetical protein
MQLTMSADDFKDRGYALFATITRGDGTATVFANTPVALALIGAVTALGVGAMLRPELGLPRDPQRPLAAGDDEDRSKS